MQLCTLCPFQGGTKSCISPLEGDRFTAKPKACYFLDARFWVGYGFSLHLLSHFICMMSKLQGTMCRVHCRCTTHGRTQLALGCCFAILLQVRLNGKAPTGSFLLQPLHTCERARLLWGSWGTECVLGLGWPPPTASL